MTKAQRSQAIAKFAELESTHLLALSEIGKRRKEFLDYWVDERLEADPEVVPTPPPMPEAPPPEFPSESTPSSKNKKN